MKLESGLQRRERPDVLQVAELLLPQFYFVLRSRDQGNV